MDADLRELERAAAVGGSRAEERLAAHRARSKPHAHVWEKTSVDRHPDAVIIAQGCACGAGRWTDAKAFVPVAGDTGIHLTVEANRRWDLTAETVFRGLRIPTGDRGMAVWQWDCVCDREDMFIPVVMAGEPFPVLATTRYVVTLDPFEAGKEERGVRMVMKSWLGRCGNCGVVYYQVGQWQLAKPVDEPRLHVGWRGP